jgi:sulfur-oxidizing protein SoxX
MRARFLRSFGLLLLCTHTHAAAPLTKVPGNPESGRAAFLDRDAGHCLLCHQVAQVNEPFQGNLGPDLSDVGSRFSAVELRERLIDPTRMNPETVMPAYYRTSGLRQVGTGYVGRPILNAQQIEDIVAFISTLKKP